MMEISDEVRAAWQTTETRIVMLIWEAARERAGLPEL